MVPLYPLKFEPIFQERIWGGRWLGELLHRPLPGSGPYGEAWVLSDQKEAPSRVSEGPLQGKSLRELLAAYGDRLLQRSQSHHGIFPLLLKFIDARDTLSVQVHPHDRHTHLLPPGQRGKTEAWVVVAAEPGSKIYVGLTPGTDEAQLRHALHHGKVADRLSWFEPKVGDCIFLPAGTVHAIGGGISLFEVQQNSDVTFRFHDWDRIDAKTGKPRQLHVEESFACTDYASDVRGPTTAVVKASGPVRREQLASCEYFDVHRITAAQPFAIGAANTCRIVVALEGTATLTHQQTTYALRRGDVVLLPAEVGSCTCAPAGKFVGLECGME